MELFRIDFPEKAFLFILWDNDGHVSCELSLEKDDGH